jgi:2-(1,2-epoxy-1,2-dihydrophenyl)acetyl-CoA isomerase
MTTELITEGNVLLTLADNGVARVHMNRPDTLNAMDVPFLQDLHHALMTCHGDPRVRVVVLSGEGKSFSGGGDVKTFLSKGDALPDYLRQATTWLQLVVAAMHGLSAPVLASVQGWATGGGGLGLVSASDLVVAAESARFRSGVALVGMAPDAGVSVTLTQLVGLRKAQEILLTSTVVPAAEALRIGLVTTVVPDEELEAATGELADRVAALPPRAVAGIKRLIWEGVGAGVPARLADESRTVSELSGTEDALEGLAAIVERRTPRFVGR